MVKIQIRTQTYVNPLKTFKDYLRPLRIFRQKVEFDGNLTDFWKVRK